MTWNIVTAGIIGGFTRELGGRRAQAAGGVAPYRARDRRAVRLAWRREIWWRLLARRDDANDEDGGRGMERGDRTGPGHVCERAGVTVDRGYQWNATVTPNLARPA